MDENLYFTAWTDGNESATPNLRKIRSVVIYNYNYETFQYLVSNIAKYLYDYKSMISFGKIYSGDSIWIHIMN